MPGFGLAPFGLSAVGLGSPVGLPAPGQGYETSVDLVPARALDLRAQDYEVDDDQTGSPHGEWEALAQNVVLRLGTPRGSLAFDRTFGNPFLLLRKVPVDLAGAAQKGTYDALADLIADGQVQLVSVTAERLNGTVIATVLWRDLRTGRDTPTPVTARGL